MWTCSFQADYLRSPDILAKKRAARPSASWHIFRSAPASALEDNIAMWSPVKRATTQQAVRKCGPCRTFAAPCGRSGEPVQTAKWLNERFRVVPLRLSSTVAQRRGERFTRLQLSLASRSCSVYRSSSRPSGREAERMVDTPAVSVASLTMKPRQHEALPANKPEDLGATLRCFTATTRRYSAYRGCPTVFHRLRIRGSARKLESAERAPGAVVEATRMPGDDYSIRIGRPKSLFAGAF